MKRILPFLHVCCLFAPVVGVESPEGFAVWSKGGHEVAELKYARLAKNQGVVAGSMTTLVKRASFSDIECNISFDGKFVAFARQLAHHNGCCTDNPGDYHAFANYDVYIARIDGQLPAKPVRIGYGYWPSWGDDSDGPVKTLYYSKTSGSGVGTGNVTVQKATVKDDGTFSGPVAHHSIRGNFVMTSPDGSKIAYRTQGVDVWDIARNKRMPAGGGCHPAWCSDSYWLMWARRNVAAYHNGSRVYVGTSGLHDYHYGCANDMSWVIGRIGASGNDQNTDHAIIAYPLDASKPGEPPRWAVDKTNGLQISSGT